MKIFKDKVFYCSKIQYHEKDLSAWKDAIYDYKKVRVIDVANGEQETNEFVDRYELGTRTLRWLVSHPLRSRESKTIQS